MNLGILRSAGIDTFELMHTLMDNRDILITVLNKFLEDNNYSELKKVFDCEDKDLDYEAIEKYSHTLKGTSATLAMTELHICLQKLVDNVRNQKYNYLREDFANVTIEYEKLTKAIMEWKVSEEIS